jgi:DNA-binding MarR family transcriptional regulator
MLNYLKEGSDAEPTDAPLDLPTDGVGEADLEEMATTLLTLAKRIRVLFGLALAEAGYHNGQDHLLTCLVRGKPVTVSALADSLGVRPSTVSKMLDRLSDKGLVERGQLRTDARITTVCLTPAGEQAQAEIRRLWATVCRQVADGLPGDPGAAMQQLRSVSEVLATRLARLR